jgi:hypothetical protein
MRKLWLLKRERDKKSKEKNIRTLGSLFMNTHTFLDDL